MLFRIVSEIDSSDCLSNEGGDLLLIGKIRLPDAHRKRIAYAFFKSNHSQLQCLLSLIIRN